MDAQEELENDAKVLQSYFSKDKRFVWIKAIAEGAYGTAHRLQYQYQQNGMIKTTDFIVKKAQNTEEARENLRNERRHLEIIL
ncbi:hypothetical protein Hte_010133 [Hypoxylon texense]